MEEIQMSPELLKELEKHNIKDSVEGLIEFHKTAENFFSSDELTDEMRERVSQKMQKITQAYLRICRVNFLYSYDYQKVDGFKKALAGFDVTDVAAAKDEMDSVKQEIQDIQDEFDREIAISMEIVNNRHEELKAKKILEFVAQEQEKMRALAESAKSTVTVNLQENSLALTKKGFFERLTDALFESPEDDWERQDIEREGKHIVTYIDENGRKRSEYELTDNIKENEARDRQAKKIGFFTRIKTAFVNDDERKEKVEARKKINAIDEEIKAIGDIATEKFCEYADQRIEEFATKIAGKLNFKQVIDNLSKNHDWAAKTRKTLEEKGAEIAQQIEGNKKTQQKSENKKRKSRAEEAVKER